LLSLEHWFCGLKPSKTISPIFACFLFLCLITIAENQASNKAPELAFKDLSVPVLREANIPVPHTFFVAYAFVNHAY